jgi:hypothetical protein
MYKGENEMNKEDVWNMLLKYVEETGYDGDYNAD